MSGAALDSCVDACVDKYVQGTRLLGARAVGRRSCCVLSIAVHEIVDMLFQQQNNRGGGMM